MDGKSKKEEFTLGELVFKGGTPVGLYVKELEGNNIGVFFFKKKETWKVNLDTQKREERIGG